MRSPMMARIFVGLIPECVAKIALYLCISTVSWFSMSVDSVCSDNRYDCVLVEVRNADSHGNLAGTHQVFCVYVDIPIVDVLQPYIDEYFNTLVSEQTHTEDQVTRVKCALWVVVSLLIFVFLFYSDIFRTNHFH